MDFLKSGMKTDNLSPVETMSPGVSMDSMNLFMRMDA